MARRSSRKYYSSTPIYETQVVYGGIFNEKDTGKKLIRYYMYHPEGTVIVQVHDADCRTVMKSSYGGHIHTEERLAVFDEGHLKRVTRTFVQDIIAKAAGGEVKNAVMKKADYLKDVKKLKLGL